jgi:NAD(P)-dependent dehydrogenase (short-subunit alcohol dehydrogenase family)
MKISFESKVVVISGGGRGIGRAISIMFASSGAYVVIIDNNKKDGMSVVSGIHKDGFSAEYVYADLSNAANSESLINKLIERHGRLDVLVNNARSGNRTNPLMETLSNVQLTASVTLFSPMLLSQAFINCQHEVRQDCSSISIINISSIAAEYAGSESLSYHTFKSGVEGMTRYLAKHGGRNGVRVNAIRPGFIVQDEHLKRYHRNDNSVFRSKAEYSHPLGEVGTVDDVAKLVLFLSSDSSHFITGQVITVDGGLTIQDQWDLIIKSPYSK